MVIARPPSRRALSLAVLVAATLGCEVNGTTGPRLESRAVVHAVLNPTSAQQVVIVERTLRSEVVGSGTPSREPIGNARVVLYGPRQDSVIGVRAPGATDGVYRVPSVTISDGSAGSAGPNVLRLRPGERYRLRVETPLGVVLGETMIPVGGGVDGARRTLNVDRDTLKLNTTVARAAGYLLRHETSTSAREHYTTSLDAPLIFPLAQSGGDDRPWAFAFAREAIRPGLAQTFVVVALDSNYFRYYVSGFDPFGDDTRGNTLTGGVGLFGSVAPLMSKTLDLIADVDTPIEGTWTADRNSATMPLTITLYTSPFFPGETLAGRMFLSGRGRTSFGRLLEATGATNGAAVSLELIDVTGGSGTVLATGLFDVDALVLSDGPGGERVTYRKR